MECLWKFFHFPQAHDNNAIKCLAMDPHEEFFVTGSADGDIKVSCGQKINERHAALCDPLLRAI